ncbi:MAG: hypothetical protein ACI9BD_000323 [Candidatus Marinamargulisbacteria bacterium]|jgi:hypothetical protein
MKKVGTIALAAIFTLSLGTTVFSEVKGTDKSGADQSALTAEELLSPTSVTSGPDASVEVIERENVRALSGVLENMKKVKIISYDMNERIYNTKTSTYDRKIKTYHEMNSDSMIKAFPEIVDGRSGYVTINQDRLIPILIQAINEQQKRIEKLEGELK